MTKPLALVETDRVLKRGDPIAQEARAALADGLSLDACAIEGAAEQLLREAPDVSAEGLCEAMGGTLTARLMPEELPALASVGGIVVVDPRLPPSVWRVAVIHESAHVLLDLTHPHARHSDVWALTLAILMPRALARRYPTAGGLAAAAGVPLWTASLRLRMCAVEAELQAS